MSEMFKSSTVRTFTLSVTPDLAREMLATSVGNRHIRESHVKALAALQRRGEWMLTHQGVAFDRNGALRDGHHRLTAVTKSGVTVPMMVTVGLDPESTIAMDQGALRTLADITGLDKRVAEALRLATTIALGDHKPTAPQVRTVAAGGIEAILSDLIHHCGSTRRYYSSAPMKLAAALTIMDGGSHGFVFGQYRALVDLDFDNMTAIAKALVRQVDVGRVAALNTPDALARGLRVFDANRATMTHIPVTAEATTAALAYAKSTLLRSIGAN